MEKILPILAMIAFLGAICPLKAQCLDSSGEKTVSIPALATNGWSPWIHNFNILIPNGAIVLRVKMDFRARDHGWGGTGASANLKIVGQTIGSAKLFHDERDYSIDYLGIIPNYNISIK
jgi:hypothetical protein